MSAPGPKRLGPAGRFAHADQDPNYHDDPSRPVTGPAKSIAKRVQTRAQHRSFPVTKPGCP